MKNIFIKIDISYEFYISFIFQCSITEQNMKPELLAIVENLWQFTIM